MRTAQPVCTTRRWCHADTLRVHQVWIEPTGAGAVKEASNEAKEAKVEATFSGYEYWKTPEPEFDLEALLLAGGTARVLCVRV